MRIIVSGTRYATVKDHGDQIAMALDWYIDRFHDEDSGIESLTIVHGGARGVDEIAGKLAGGSGCTVEVHTADWAGEGKAAGPIRNQKMVNLGADLVLAFPPAGSKGKGGTWDLIHRASDAEMMIHICPLRILVNEVK